MPTGSRSVDIAGDKTHPANNGRLCATGMGLGEHTDLDGRLLYPEIGGKRATWDRAIALIARRLAETIARHGPDSVAFSISGQLPTEDHYVANKLMKGFIGAANIATDADACLVSAAAGHVRAFGEDVVPATYEDIDCADLIVLAGTDTALHQPILHRRIMAAREARGTKIVVIDPERTASCDEADLHLPIRPGTDIALMNGLLAYCQRAGVVDEAWMARSIHTPNGFWDAIIQDHDLWSVARTCDLSPTALKDYYDLFVASPRTITLFGQGINRSRPGADPVNAILNVHLATARIGKPGAGPFALAARPNAMGGREVGTHAGSLAAHMDFAPDTVALVGRFWASPGMAAQAGPDAETLFRRVGEGRIKALWMIGDPPPSLPAAAGPLHEALATCPFVVMSDRAADSDNGRHAHVRLPAADWSERDGTITGPDRLISRQRAIFPLPAEVKPQWWIMTRVARAMGWRENFPFDRPAEIYREHARLSAYQNDGRRLFSLRRHASISNPAYDELTPWRWGDVPFDEGRFPTSDGKARLVGVE